MRLEIFQIANCIPCDCSFPSHQKMACKVQVEQANSTMTTELRLQWDWLPWQTQLALVSSSPPSSNFLDFKCVDFKCVDFDFVDFDFVDFDFVAEFRRFNFVDFKLFWFRISSEARYLTKNRPNKHLRPERITDRAYDHGVKLLNPSFFLLDFATIYYLILYFFFSF